MLQRKTEQLALDLPHRPAHGREDFLVGDANAAAVAWLDKWPDWPAPLLVIHGPPASGKSHLAAVWRERTNAQIIQPQNLEPQNLGANHVVLDGLDLWLGDREIETRIFHLYNLFKEDGRSILATMRMCPTEISFSLPDLASRFRAAPLVSIQAPDDDLLMAVLIKLFHDRQIQVGEDVIAYVLPRMERSFAAAHEIAVKADMLAMARKKPLSVPLMREVLSAMQDADV